MRRCGPHDGRRQADVAVPRLSGIPRGRGTSPSLFCAQIFTKQEADVPGSTRHALGCSSDVADKPGHEGTIQSVLIELCSGTERGYRYTDRAAGAGAYEDRLEPRAFPPENPQLMA